MKIAIMTWFSYYNYGTALQVYALNHYLKSKGHKIDIIKYYPRPNAVDEKTVSLSREIFQKIIGKMKRVIDPITLDIKCKDFFDGFVKSSFTFTDECESQTDLENLNSKYDVFICGSDQIWSQLCFDPHYFLDFVSDKRRTIAYAPSMGVSVFINKNYELQIKSLVNDISYISVREVTGKRLLQQITNKPIQIAVDPTFLLTADEWRSILNIENDSDQKYLLAFFIGTNEKNWKRVLEISKSKKLRLLIIPCHKFDYFRTGEICEGVGPREFLKFIANADLICSDSFHALALGINFNKEVYGFKRFKDSSNDNQNSRVLDLFSRLKISDHIIEGRCYNIPPYIDYLKVNQKLSKLRESSFYFIQESLNKIKELDNITQTHNINENHSLCCGCGVCSTVCPVNAITMTVSRDGFNQANVDKGKCISCKQCVKVCPFRENTEKIDILEGQMFAYKDKLSTLKKSSSGGAAYRLALELNRKGYSIVGCAFNDSAKSAEHIMIKPNQESALSQLQGSKYIQSTFCTVIDEVNNVSGPIAIFGTPCQIAAARKLFLKRSNILYIDIVCHGTPSLLMYYKYLQHLSKKECLDLSTQVHIDFRYKNAGWHKKYICVSDGKKEYIASQSKDIFQLLFNSGICYSSACYECRWRSKSAADLRLGDYWGNRYINDKTGVSMVLSLTHSGDKLIDLLANVPDKQFLTKTKIDDYFYGQQTKINQRPMFYYEVMEKLRSNDDNIEEITNRYALPIFQYDQMYVRLLGIYRKIRNIK